MHLYKQAFLPSPTSKRNFYRERKNGDLQLNFLRDDVYPDRRYENITRTFRLGFHEAFSPGSHLLVSLIYQNADDSVKFSIIPGLNVEASKPQESYSGELQYQHGLENIKFVFGGGYQKTNSELAETLIFSPPDFEAGTDVL